MPSSQDGAAKPRARRASACHPGLFPIHDSDYSDSELEEIRKESDEYPTALAGAVSSQDAPSDDDWAIIGKLNHIPRRLRPLGAQKILYTS